MRREWGRRRAEAKVDEWKKATCEKGFGKQRRVGRGRCWGEKHGEKIRESNLKEGGEVTGWGWQGQEELGKRRTARYLIAERLQLFSQVAGGITGRKLAFTWMLIPLFLPVWQDECLLSW